MTSVDRYRLGVMHHRLEEAIAGELKRRVPDMIRLMRLKKLKLAIRDRMAGHLPVPA